MIRVKQSLEPAAMFVCKAHTLSSNKGEATGIEALELARLQDLKQKNNLWLENRSETRFNASLVLCYVIQAKLKGRLDYPKR